jgi:hypothetical protein
LSDEQLEVGTDTGIINREATREDIKLFRDTSLPSDQPTSNEKPSTSKPKGIGKTVAQDKTKRRATKHDDQIDENGFEDDSSDLDELTKLEKELAGEETSEEEDDFSKFEKELAGDEPSEQHDVTFEDLKHRWEHKGLLHCFDWDRASKKDRERFWAEVLC